MKNLVFALALLCSTSLVAQFSYNENGTGIQSSNSIASGDYSISLGVQTEAIGNVATAMGAITTASGTNSTAIGYDTTASGDYSTALGRDTTASGNVSTAMGYQNEASGDYSTALGWGTKASSETATATGQFTTASGKFSLSAGLYSTASGTTSVALGNNTIADGYGTLATGYFNTPNSNPQADTFTPTNTAFVIGNGTFDNRSNAFEVLFDGTTTINGNTNLNGWTYFNEVSEFNSDLIIKNSMRFGEQGIIKVEENNGKLHISDGNVSISNDLEVNGQIVAPAFIGDGSQLTNLPTPSVDYGDITNTPLSFNDNGSGIQSSTNTANGDYSTAMGEGTTASGNVSIAMGYFTIASGDYSTAMGVSTTASGTVSTAMGQGNTASGFVSTALGEFTQASGNYSTAMGQGTSAQDYGTIAIGIFNKTKETSNPNQYSLQNTAFVIGNGVSDNRSNALEVLFDGTTTIAGDLNINSDARLKANIISLGATLSKLLQIDGKTYTMKKDTNHKKKIGLLAQDIEKVFPELVTETNDIKSVNYQGLVPVLINAMKEQDEVIRSQDSRLNSQETKLGKQEAILNKQQKKIDELEAMVKALAKG